jgi:hypothetical protein
MTETVVEEKPVAKKAASDDEEVTTCKVPLKTGPNKGNRINLDTEIEHGLMNEYMVCVESNVHWIPNISCTAASTSKLHAVFRKIVSTSVKPSKLHAVFRKITEDGKTFTSLVYVTKDHHIYDDYKQDNMYTITCV